MCTVKVFGHWVVKICHFNSILMFWNSVFEMPLCSACFLGVPHAIYLMLFATGFMVCLKKGSERAHNLGASTVDTRGPQDKLSKFRCRLCSGSAQKIKWNIPEKYRFDPEVFLRLWSMFWPTDPERDSRSAEPRLTRGPVTDPLWSLWANCPFRGLGIRSRPNCNWFGYQNKWQEDAFGCLTPEWHRKAPKLLPARAGPRDLPTSDSPRSDLWHPFLDGNGLGSRPIGGTFAINSVSLEK